MSEFEREQANETFNYLNKQIKIILALDCNMPSDIPIHMNYVWCNVNKLIEQFEKNINHE